MNLIFGAGRCYPRETLVEILRFCEKHQLHLIADEIYGLSVFNSGDADAVQFTSVLSLDIPEIIDSNLVHVLYGLSKVYLRERIILDEICADNI
jgi:1-aminocyclopropane-1-carboxylate synthase